MQSEEAHRLGSVCCCEGEQGKARSRQGWGGQRGGDAGSLLWVLMERRAAGLGAPGLDAVQ